MEDQGSIRKNRGKGFMEFEKNKENNQSRVIDWRKLFSTLIDQTLSFLQPQSLNGRVQVLSEILEEGELKWQCSCGSMCWSNSEL